MKKSKEPAADKRVKQELLDIVKAITDDKDKQERLMKLFWRLNNAWCRRVAKKVKKYLENGKPPDMEYSRAVKLTFEEAIKILNRPPNPLKGENRTATIVNQNSDVN